MPDIDIHRPHHLGMARARAAMRQWIVRVEHNYGVVCRYDEDPKDQDDEIDIGGAGAEGVVHVRPDAFHIQLDLGPFAKLMAPMIEDKMRRHLDALLAEHPADGVGAPPSEAA